MLDEQQAHEHILDHPNDGKSNGAHQLNNYIRLN